MGTAVHACNPRDSESEARRLQIGGPRQEDCLVY